MTIDHLEIQIEYKLFNCKHEQSIKNKSANYTVFIYMRIYMRRKYKRMFCDGVQLMVLNIVKENFAETIATYMYWKY